MWKQESEDVSSESSCSSKGGAYRAKAYGDGGRCYSYNVLERICIMVAYTEHPETASYTWEYRGGCYQNGEIAVYKPASVGYDYLFDYIPIEVREDESLYGKLANTSTQVGSGLGSIFSLLSMIFTALSVISGILFAVFYFKALKDSQFGGGGEVKH